MALNSATIISIQDIMRKDAGVDGDAQRLRQLTWLFFLKIFDDREQDWEITVKKYRSTAPLALEAAGAFNTKLDAFMTSYDAFFSLATVSPMDADYKAARKQGEERASLKFDLTKKLLLLLDERIQVHEVIQQALASARNEARKNLERVQAEGEAAMAGMFERIELKAAVAKTVPVKEATAIMELHRENVSALNRAPNVTDGDARRFRNQLHERLNAWFQRHHD